MKERPILLVSTACGVALALGLSGLAFRARADGIPSPNPLYYSGTLLEGGQPVTGSRALAVALYTAQAGGAPLCQTPPQSVGVSGGRFRVQLPDACRAQVNGNPNLYLEAADGPVLLPRTKIGAVPYAVEADHAVNANTATSASAATYAADAGHAGSADNAVNATNSTHASSADTASLANGVAQNAPLAALTTGSLAANAAATQPVTFTTEGTYLLSASLFGMNTDLHRTYVIHVPGNPNLNLDFASILSSSYLQGGINLATQNGAPSGYTLNSNSNYTLELTFTTGADKASWSYAAVRLM